MAKVTIPRYSSDLITMLMKRFPDRFDTDNTMNCYERGKYGGIVELLRELKNGLEEIR